MFLFVFSCIHLPAEAEEEADTDVLTGEQDAEKQRVKAEKQAKSRKVFDEIEAVSFEQILADPDNVERNVAFAKEMINKGELLSAASTLDRVLSVNPDLARIRLFYAVVLFRLDNLSEAEVQFEMIRKLEIPDDLRSEVDSYLSQIRSRHRRFHFTLRQSDAFQLDTNRNASPSSKQRLLRNIRSNVAPSDGPNRDTSFLNITSVDMSYDLGFQAGHTAFAKFDYFLAEQTQADFLDLSAYQHEYGLHLKNEFVNVTPSFFVSHVLLSHETFLRSQGATLLLERDVLKRFHLFASGTMAREDFTNITENNASHERAGDTLSSVMGWSTGFWKNRMIFSNYISFFGKDAKEEYNAYRRVLLGMSHTLLPGRGQFLVNLVELGRDDYEAPDLALAGRLRHNQTLRYRGTYGAPLDFFFLNKLPKLLKDVTLTVTYEYFRSISNVTNYTFRNNKVQTMLTKTFSF